MTALNAMHDKMQRLLRDMGGRVDAIFFCPHNPESDEPPCGCRKPLPGLFEEIRERYGVDMRTVHTAGDTSRDLHAGATVGCPTHLVCTGKSQHKIPDGLPVGTVIHADLLAFADWVITHEKSD
jgi:D-glycero-D-manno-heptose 1,7-bisphosphate phosphatase